MTYMQINCERFHARFPASFRCEIARAMASLCIDHAFWRYGVGSWANRRKYLPFEFEQVAGIGDLYPPNVAALDFLLDKIRKPKEETVLDFPCGVGNLIPFLTLAGFSAYGCDAWVHLRREEAIEFLGHFKLENRLLAPTELKDKNFTVVIVVGLDWDRGSDLISPLLEKGTVNYFMHSRVGGRWEEDMPIGPDFQAVAEYDHLLRVYQRKK